MIKNIHGENYTIIKQFTNDDRQRHLIMILEKDSQKYFYKELNNDDTSRFIEQIDFQKAVEKSAKKVIIPKLYDFDLKGEKKWGLWAYLEGKHLAEWRSKNINGFKKWLEPIVDCLIELEKIPPFKADYDIIDRMLLRIDQWSKKPLKENLYSTKDKNKIVQFIKKNRRKIEVGFNHSDFVPWHMHEIKFPKFALVDYENCKNKPKYYDLAYFYHRVYTKIGEPRLAEKFLDLYKKKTNLGKDFNNKFLPVLGQRIIGGFYDYCVLDDKTDLKLHQQLLDKLLIRLSDR